MKRKTNRREFMKRSALAGVGFWIATRSSSGSISPNDKLNIAGIGAGGQGGGDIGAVASENIVALVDVDENRAGDTFKRFPSATKYKDYRKMLEMEERNIDAVTVGTPDHHHAPPSIMAMKMGKHCYCEKPLTHSAYEARMMRLVANEKKVATQMGNQGTSSGGLREGVEVVWSGGIGTVKEIHVWTNRPIWSQGSEAILKHQGVRNALHGAINAKTADLAKIPETLDWDLWLGPAPERPYDPIYLPFSWRGWWDYGTGALGDMACHTMNLPFMAAKLGSPVAVEAICSERNPETAPTWSIITYEFPKRGDLPALKLYWYDGGKLPAKDLFMGEGIEGSGSLMIGDKGTMYSPHDYGTEYRLLPKDKYADYKKPAHTLPRSPGHHREWLNACKGGPPAMSNFNYSGPLTETVVLGNLAVRVGKRVELDVENMKSTNCPEANGIIKREYRKGWTL